MSAGPALQPAGHTDAASPTQSTAAQRTCARKTRVLTERCQRAEVTAQSRKMLQPEGIWKVLIQASELVASPRSKPTDPPAGGGGPADAPTIVLWMRGEAGVLASQPGWGECIWDRVAGRLHGEGGDWEGPARGRRAQKAEVSRAPGHHNQGGRGPRGSSPSRLQPGGQVSLAQELEQPAMESRALGLGWDRSRWQCCTPRRGAQGPKGRWRSGLGD